jgi:hypothetical protein
MQMWRSVIAYHKAVARAPIPAKDKRRLFWYLSKTIYWTKGELATEIADYFRFGLLKRT